MNIEDLVTEALSVQALADDQSAKINVSHAAAGNVATVASAQAAIVAQALGATIAHAQGAATVAIKSAQADADTAKEATDNATAALHAAILQLITHAQSIVKPLSEERHPRVR